MALLLSLLPEISKSIFSFKFVVMSGLKQAGRSWQSFGEGTNGHKNFHQAPIGYFRDKYTVFERNYNFANLIQYKMQYIHHEIVHTLPKKHCL